jgi:hypothetical protein
MALYRDALSSEKGGGKVRRRHPLSTALLAGIVVLLGVMAVPGLGLGETSTSHGGTPSEVYTSTEPEGCAEVDTFGTPPILPTEVSVAQTSNLLVSFSSEWAGLQADAELLLSFRVNDDEGSFVVGTPFEWGVTNNPRTHNSGTMMWSFDDVQPGVYVVLGDARTDPVPGPAGGGNTHNNPSAAMGNCALAVFVIPVAD